MKTLLGDWYDCDTIYWIEYERRYNTCPHCNGTGEEKLNANGKEYAVKCSYCDGKRKFEINKWYINSKWLRNGLMIDRDGNIVFNDSGYITKITNKKYYKSREDVEKVVDEKNKEITTKFKKDYVEWCKKNNIEK